MAHHRGRRVGAEALRTIGLREVLARRISVEVGSKMANENNISVCIKARCLYKGESPST